MENKKPKIYYTSARFGMKVYGATIPVYSVREIDILIAKKNKKIKALKKRLKGREEKFV